MATDNKAVIVTGAASGMGLAMTIALLTNGHDVTAVDRNGEALAELAKRAANLRGTVNPVTADLAQPDSFAHIAGSALIKFGRIDALVNNAGITTFAGSGNWDALDARAFEQILGVNVVGAFQMVRACAPHLKTTRGAIVNVSSIAGALGLGSSVPYVASKGAVNAMTLHLARALAPTRCCCAATSPTTAPAAAWSRPQWRAGNGSMRW